MSTARSTPTPSRWSATGPPCGCSSPTPSCSFFAFVYLYPFLVQVTTSFKTNTDAVGEPAVARRRTRSPPAPSSGSPRRDFPLWFANSVIVTVLVTAGRVFLCSLAGYALARIKFRGRGAVFTAILAVMAVPGVILLIPKFLVLNYLGIYNTYPALVLPLLVDAAGVFIMKQFFETIPESVEEAARIDGASTFRTFWSVVLPMARPALITLTILSFQGSWNELPHFLVASQDPRPLHAHQGCRHADQRPARVGQAVPDLDGRGAADDHPGRPRLLLLPEVPRARRYGRGGEGLAPHDSGAGRGPPPSTRPAPAHRRRPISRAGPRSASSP